MTDGGTGRTSREGADRAQCRPILVKIRASISTIEGDLTVPVMPAERAQQLCETVFQRLALSESEVADCTRAIMYATLRGLDSHGIVSILPGIAASVKRGQT